MLVVADAVLVVAVAYTDDVLVVVVAEAAADAAADALPCPQGIGTHTPHRTFAKQSKFKKRMQVNPHPTVLKK